MNLGLIEWVIIVWEKGIRLNKDIVHKSLFIHFQNHNIDNPIIKSNHGNAKRP